MHQNTEKWKHVVNPRTTAIDAYLIKSIEIANSLISGHIAGEAF